MLAIGLELSRRPCVASVFKNDILQHAISEAKMCKICHNRRVKVEDELETFRVLLANAVGKALLGVRPFCLVGGRFLTIICGVSRFTTRGTLQREGIDGWYVDILHCRKIVRLRRDSLAI